ESIISDRGTQFVSTFWRTLTSRLGIKLNPSSAWHPATNGQTERINQDIEQFLRLYVNWEQNDWALWLPLAEFAGNDAISSTTGISPFFANYGMHPKIEIEPQTPRPPSMTNQQRKEFFRATEIASRFKSILDQVTSLSKQSQDRYEENANIKRSDAPLYTVGDQVIVNTQNMQLGRPVSKLSPKWEGPFKVVKSSSHAVTLKLPQNMKITPTFHVSLIQPFPMERFPGQKDEDVLSYDNWEYRKVSVKDKNSIIIIHLTQQQHATVYT
ncbi:hypothetical protein K3495_g13678, partial [Podosphaera aphanis]